MDRHDLWRDTLLIVTSDHGFLLGEHGWWAFVRPPFYSEVARKPLFIWDPRCGRRNERLQPLVQTHDLPATLLEFFGVERPPDMQGVPLRATLASGVPAREAGLFGVFGGHVNCTDGRYVYMRAPAHEPNEPLFNYTLMPAHMRQLFSVKELQTARWAPPFRFTKGLSLMQVRAQPFMAEPHRFGTLLFDHREDPEEQRPLRDDVLEGRMRQHLIRLMEENDAPAEQFARLGLR
jgi:hypothetical protein